MLDEAAAPSQLPQHLWGQCVQESDASTYAHTRGVDCIRAGRKSPEIG